MLLGAQMIDVKNLIRETISNPRTATKILLDLKVDRQVIVTGLALVLVLSTLVDMLHRLILPIPPALNEILPGAVSLLAIKAIAQLALAAAVTAFGKWLEGQGRFQDVLLLSTWLAFVALIFQMFGVALFIILPFIAALFHIATVLYGTYLFVHFVNGVHEFDNMLKSFGVVVMSALAVFFCSNFFS